MGAQMEVVHYLLSVDGINPELPDALGRRAKDYLVD